MNLCMYTSPVESCNDMEVPFFFVFQGKKAKNADPV